MRNLLIYIPIGFLWTYLSWTWGYVQGKRRGFELGEKVGKGKRRHIELVGEIH